MSIITKLKDLGKSFQILKAQQGAADRKEERINELMKGFLRQGFSPFMAANLAAEKYKQIRELHLP